MYTHGNVKTMEITQKNVEQIKNGVETELQTEKVLIKNHVMTEKRTEPKIHYVQKIVQQHQMFHVEEKTDEEHISLKNKHQHGWIEALHDYVVKDSLVFLILHDQIIM